MEEENTNSDETNNPNGSESVVIDLRSNSLIAKDTNAWLKKSFGPIGAYGGIKRELFITALREVEVLSE